MFFNSLDFAIFLPLVFICYWFIFNNNLKQQNLFLLIASYIFYGWWDYRFLSLIIISTAVDFFVGLKLDDKKNDDIRRRLLYLSLLVNLGFLAYFKYYNFFIDNFVSTFQFFGYNLDSSSLNIILPVGISFYTFQTLSYTIDIYNKKLKPTKNLIEFASFVTFFPQLVAGPIERAKNLLPQFNQKRIFDYLIAKDGMKQILWGLFKKIVIADNCAIFVNEIFGRSNDMTGSTLFIGAIFFAFQIYGDFSGYSDIAIGTAKLFGFKLMRNFSFPYFSRDIAEFWRRWHISLSSWFKDYLYIPLGGSKGGIIMKIRNTIIVFVVSGFWHGANWTYIFWGGLNALYFIPLLILNKNRENLNIVSHNRNIPTIKEFSQILLTFIMTIFAWIFFRADSVTHAMNYINGIFSISFFSFPTIFPIKLIFSLLIFILIEWLGRRDDYTISKLSFIKNKYLRILFIYILLLSIYFFGNFSSNIEFIYFQF